MKRKTSTPVQRPMLKRQKSVYNQAPMKSLQEKKFVDIGSTATVVSAQTTAVQLLLNPLSQGTTASTRIGNLVTMKSIAYRWQGRTVGATTGSSPLRIIIVYDKQSNGALAASTAIQATDEIVSYRNLTNSRRFTTLVDEEVKESISASSGPTAFIHSGYRKLNLNIEFGGNAGTVADITSGAVIALFYQNGGIGGTTLTTSFQSRIRYVDA